MNKYKILLISVLILGALIRLWNLSADPSVLLDSGQVGDEGYWTYNSRHLVLFGNLATDGYYHDFAAAPLFSLATYVSFLTFGVGFWQARVVSAIAGTITLLLTFLIAKQINERVALLATFLVAINTMLIMHSRLAVGESFSITFATIGIYFLLKKNTETISGFSYALSLLSKTTSYLYLPSALLILISTSKPHKVISRRMVNFSLAFITFFVVGFGYLLLNWGKQIRLIYSTFGQWYVPKNPTELWQNILSFIMHPFWGSPFLFTLLLLALLNVINYSFYKKGRTYERKFLILWLFGIVLLGPTISVLPNARLLGMIVPIAILGAQAVFDPRVRIIDFKKLKISSNTSSFVVLAFLSGIPIAVGSAKLTLAIVKRVTGNELVVNYLFSLSIFYSILLLIMLLKKKKLLISVIRTDIFLFLFLPIASFIPLFLLYLNFFMLISLPKALLISVLILLVFILFLFTFNFLFSSKKFILLLIVSYIIFNSFGVATILYKPSHNIEESAAKLGNLVGHRSLIGFYGQELSLGNVSRPIYWAPNLNFAGGLNSDWRKYDPKYLLVTQVFDSKPGNPEAWPSQKDIKTSIDSIITLNLTREFWKAKREFRINVYVIND